MEQTLSSEKFYSDMAQLLGMSGKNMNKLKNSNTMKVSLIWWRGPQDSQSPAWAPTLENLVNQGKTQV